MDYRKLEDMKQAIEQHRINARCIKTPEGLSRGAVKWWRYYINGGYCWEGILKHYNGWPITKENMEKDLGITTRTRQRILKELKEKGLVKKEKGKLGRCKKVWVYRVEVRNFLRS